MAGVIVATVNEWMFRTAGLLGRRVWVLCRERAPHPQANGATQLFTVMSMMLMPGLGLWPQSQFLERD